MRGAAASSPAIQIYTVEAVRGLSNFSLGRRAVAGMCATVSWRRAPRNHLTATDGTSPKTRSDPISPERAFEQLSHPDGCGAKSQRISRSGRHPRNGSWRLLRTVAVANGSSGIRSEWLR